ncbi:MAG: thiol protease [Rikenellaceae bacterium]
MKVKGLFSIIFTIISTALFAQAVETERKIYPQPELTPEVEAIMATRVRWQGGISTRSSTTLPEYVDNSTSKYFPPIFNQQGGSCAQAAGVGYVFNYEMNRLRDTDASATSDNRFSYLYVWNFINEGIDQGGYASQGFSLLKEYGAMSENDYGVISTYSYKWATGYDKYLNAIKHKVDQMYVFDNDSYENIEVIKSYLYDKGDGLTGGGLLTFAAYSTGWSFNSNYSGPSNTGYKCLLTGLASDGAHAMTIVGYDDAVESYNSGGEKCYGAFIAVNSWGSYQHDNGRYYLPYHYFAERTAGMSENILSSTMDAISVKVSEPEVVLRVKLDYSSRDDLSMQYGASQSYDATLPVEKFNLSIIKNQGGDYPMQGQYSSSSELEFAVDISTLFERYDNPVRIYLNVLSAQRGSVYGSGNVSSVEVYDYRNDSLLPDIYEAQMDASQDLGLGDNYYTLTPKAVSASEYQYRGSDNKLKSYYIRRADGSYSKIEIDASNYYYGDKLIIKHRSNLKGGTNLDN